MNNFQEYAEAILEESCAVINNNHFVYKAGTHGSAYINKEKFPFIGALKMQTLLRCVVCNAKAQGLSFSKEDGELIGIIGPAMGATAYPLVLAMIFEEEFPGLKFFPARTELEIDKNGKKIHVLPEKLRADYEGKTFIIFDDIGNNGTTIIEVRELFTPIARIKEAEVIVDRGGLNAEKLGVGSYNPLLRVKMEQHEVKKCLDCKNGVPINTVLGKGALWVKLFGQPPYPDNYDFSRFWTE